MRRLVKVFQVAGAVSLLGLGLGSTAMGCLERPIDPLTPRTTSTVVERLHQSGVDKIDLLLAVDNSISMADKQAILAFAVPDLVNRFVTPNCVDEDQVANGTVVDANGECAIGQPEFPPIRDINIGIISSSLGDLTSNACNTATVLNPDDRAHLIVRGGGGTTVPTYQDKGFLAWDPDAKRDPAGELVAANLADNLRSIVVGVDQVGCGYEMQLESILRFLVDPDPYDSLSRNGNYLQEVGTDEDLLTQRADFLRPDSLLAVLILSDENDCSVDITGQGFLALSSTFYRSTSECETDPNSDCCKSCGLPHDGCDVDGACTANGGKWESADDHPNLKCWHQKQRYGLSFLYPVQRYINAFTQTNIDPTQKDYRPVNPGEGELNPLFKDLKGLNRNVRDPGLVFVAGIVGVPWQALAKDPTNLKNGGFKTFEELQDDLDALVGDPDTNVEPTDPFMRESMAPRTGTSPILGVDPSKPNNINGHDYNVFDKADLQYTCTFDLDQPVVTIPPGQLAPDCYDCTAAVGCNNPLCDPNALTTQVKAKAYPGLREMSFLRGMGNQGIFASICPAQQNDNTASDFGYRPAVNAIVDRLKNELDVGCLGRTLTPDLEGNTPCLILELSRAEGTCSCDADDGRVAIPEQIDGSPNPKYNAVKAALQDEYAPEAPNEWNCFCEIQQVDNGQPEDASDDFRDECQNNPDPDASSQGDGWCYIDATTVPQTGDPQLVQNCPADERRLIRFVGNGDQYLGSTVFITCSGE